MPPFIKNVRIATIQDMLLKIVHYPKVTPPPMYSDPTSVNQFKTGIKIKGLRVQKKVDGTLSLPLRQGSMECSFPDLRAH